MNADTIRGFCLNFPQATEKLQWGDELCFKVGDKIFVMLGLDNPRICFKCSPETFAELIEREDIRPAPYVGRYKWVLLERLDAIDWNELQDLIRSSYEMVAAKAPKLTQRESKRNRTKNRAKPAKSAVIRNRPTRVARKKGSSGR
jgi:predicted DNA-binding protein (MmcQ/YjbR family)